MARKYDYRTANEAEQMCYFALEHQFFAGKTDIREKIDPDDLSEAIREATDSFRRSISWKDADEDDA